MKSITIHGLDDPLDSLIRKKRKTGNELNKTIKKLLAESLGVAPGSSGDHKKDFLDLSEKTSRLDCESGQAAGYPYQYPVPEMSREITNQFGWIFMG